MAIRKSPEINASSMADIAFLLLIFFLITTTMDVDSGIVRMLPPYVEEPEPITKEIIKRNVFVVLINSNDQFFVNGKPGDLKTLRIDAKEFLTPHYPDNPSYPQTDDVDLPYLGLYHKSKGVISMQNDRGTSYKTYIHVQNELAAAVRELRDELTKKQFNINTYAELQEIDEEKAAAIAKAIPVPISEAEPVNFSDAK